MQDPAVVRMGEHFKKEEQDSSVEDGSFGKKGKSCRRLLFERSSTRGHRRTSRSLAPGKVKVSLPPPWVTALPGVCVLASLGYNPEISGMSLALMCSSCGF